MIRKILLERFSTVRHHEIKSFQAKFSEVKRDTEKIRRKSLVKREKELRRENNTNEHMNINEETKAF